MVLWKLGSSDRTDASQRPFDAGSNLKLAEACRKFLMHPGKDNDFRKWAVEGLSYLTLDAEVKRKLSKDKSTLQALIELAKTGDQSLLHGVITTLVNLCNAYDKKEVTEELIALENFAKQHIPEEHEFDDPEFGLETHPNPREHRCNVGACGPVEDGEQQFERTHQQGFQRIMRRAVPAGRSHTTGRR